MTRSPKPEITIRRASPENAAVCGRICFEAFRRINQSHGFPCDFKDAESAAGALAVMFSDAGFYCVVAECDGRVVGSNCLDERCEIFGVGPITVAPTMQNRGVGRLLMHAVLDRARERGAAGVRLVQAAFHGRSLSLYASLGFEVREPLVCMQARTARTPVAGCTVRAAVADDVEQCNRICRFVHHFDRGGELSEAIRQSTALVVVREGRVTGYATALAFFGHAAAATNLDLRALIASAESFGGPGILVPSRNSDLLQWCLANGMRVTQPMTLMSRGAYAEPAGAWLPSVLF
jgi:predicted N-acetyltransferase YhbS